MRPRIRRATAADAPALAAVQAAAWRRAYRGLLASEYLAALRPVSLLAAWNETLAGLPRAPPCEEVLVAEAGAVVGYCHVGSASGDPSRLPGRDSGEVFSLYVHPHRWGRGLGSALLERAEAGLVAAGFAWGILWVLEDNVSARAFYEASGWRPDGARQFDYLGGRSYPLVRYARALAQRSSRPATPPSPGAAARRGASDPILV